MTHRPINNLVLVHLNDFLENLICYVNQHSRLIFPTCVCGCVCYRVSVMRMSSLTKYDG